MLGLSNEGQNFLGTVLIVGGVAIGGYAVYNYMSKPKKKENLSGCGRKGLAAHKNSSQKKSNAPKKGKCKSVRLR